MPVRRGNSVDIKALSDKVSAAFLARARRMKLASRLVQLVMLIGAAAVAGVAQFAEFSPQGPSGWQITGIAASLIVGLGAIFSGIVDEDASKELALAQNALEEARNAQDQYQDLNRINAELEKAIELYQVMLLARGVLEQSTQIPATTEVRLVSTILEACERSLPIAMGFAQSDRWTICIYKAVGTVPGPITLECIAHYRAIKCDLTNARKWAAGTGIAGSAYANRDEIIIDDLQVPSLQSVFGTAANVQKPDDPTLYRSMAAVPIMVTGSAEPWGVVTATNDRPGHFSPISGMGIDASEGVRALSSMVALAVACFNQPARITAP